jgi:RNA 2',3'-cyclic 3'-phosphodiesterase
VASGGATRRAQRAGRPRARLFLALDLPQDARNAMAAWRDELIAGRDELRPVAPAALHVTLVFLGWQFERDVERIAELAGGAVGDLDAAHLAPLGVKPVPPRGPRLFALDLADAEDRASRVQAALSRALVAGGLYTPEKRPFWPHITLARVKRGRRASGLGASRLPLEFDASRVTLYRSTLLPQGAVYEPLAATELSPSGRA